LPQNFVTVETEYELRLISDPIVPCNFRRDITVDLDYLQKSIFRSQFGELLICDFALRIPAGSEIDESVGEPVLAQVGVELLEACEVFEVGVKESVRDFEHDN
jgi:hypothetical protein